ncbi:MAG TPA: hypothetical protein VHG69_08670 [Thermoleophilaceae bacterium]|nr:hypothetical protein [Thermoleophilaceae bacterium]
MRRLALFIALAFVLAAPAWGFVAPITRDANLDGDPGTERILVRPHRPTDAQDDFERTQVRVRDTCPPGTVDRRIAPIHDNLERLRLRRVDRRPGAEIFLVLRDGARGVLGEARLVAWRPDPAACRREKALFVYDSDRHTATPRGGTGDISFFNARFTDREDRFDGPEILVDERFLRRGDPPFAGSIRKLTFWRYHLGRDRYVRYDARVIRSGR